jgi:hypothetical protein
MTLPIRQHAARTDNRLQFVSTGFTQEAGCRVFAYEVVSPDRVRTRFSVRADLALSRQFGIQLQELPLMCMGILEHCVTENKALVTDEGMGKRALTFTEEAMRRYSDEFAAARTAAALKRNAPRRQSANATEAVTGNSSYNAIPVLTRAPSW